MGVNRWLTSMVGTLVRVSAEVKGLIDERKGSRTVDEYLRGLIMGNLQSSSPAKPEVEVVKIERVGGDDWVTMTLKDIQERVKYLTTERKKYGSNGVKTGWKRNPDVILVEVEGEMDRYLSQFGQYGEFTVGKVRDGIVWVFKRIREKSEEEVETMKGPGGD